MKPAPSGTFFAKRKNYKRVVVLAYKIDAKIRLLLGFLLKESLSRQEKDYIFERIQKLSCAEKRLRSYCHQYELEFL